MKHNTNFIIWWLAFVLHLAGLFLAYQFGLHEIFWLYDITYLSSAILCIWALASIKIGISIHRRMSSRDSLWFIADSCLSLGMIGTVIGFIYMLSNTFDNLDPGNIESMRDAIATMASGMSTALLTTLSGLLASLSIKLQLIIEDA